MNAEEFFRSKGHEQNDEGWMFSETDLFDYMSKYARHYHLQQLEEVTDEDIESDLYPNPDSVDAAMKRYIDQARWRSRQTISYLIQRAKTNKSEE